MVTRERRALNTGGSQCQRATTDIVHDPAIKIPQHCPTSGEAPPGISNSGINPQSKLPPGGVEQPESAIDIGGIRGRNSVRLCSTAEQHRQAPDVTKPAEETFIKWKATGNRNDSCKR